MATKKAGGANKQKTTPRAAESKRISNQDRAPQRPRVPTNEKTRSKGRYPGSTPTADDEMARKDPVRPARGGKTATLTSRKRANPPRPR